MILGYPLLHKYEIRYIIHIFLKSEGVVGGGEGSECDATQRRERVCRTRVLTRYLIFFRRPMNVNRVIRSIFAAAASIGEIMEE